MSLLLSAVIWADQCTGRPNQALIFILFISGISLFFLRNVIPKSISSSDYSRDDFPLPLQEINSSNALKGPKYSSSEQDNAAQSLRPQRRRLLQICLAVVLSLRVGILSLILYNQQCTIPSFEVGWQSREICESTNLA